MRLTSAAEMQDLTRLEDAVDRAFSDEMPFALTNKGGRTEADLLQLLAVQTFDNAARAIETTGPVSSSAWRAQETTAGPDAPTDLPIDMRAAQDDAMVTGSSHAWDQLFGAGTALTAGATSGGFQPTSSLISIAEPWQHGGCTACLSTNAAIAPEFASAGSLTNAAQSPTVAPALTSYVDALLNPYGWQWGSFTPGTAATVTYSFLTSVPSYYSFNADERINFAAMNAAQQDAVRDILRLYAEAANISFVEVSGVGSITFGTADLGAGIGGWAYYPAAGYSGPSNGNQAGDVWITNRYAGYDNPALGSWQYQAFIHEIGHALGLKHPGNYDAGSGTAPGPFLPASEDSHQYTVMSYYSGPAYNHTEPITPQLYDLAAIQYLYGANTATRTGDDIYTFITSLQVKSIWDAGGDDVFDASNQLAPVTINLRPGSFSSIAGTNNIAIAFGTSIEAAIGSNYSDVLTAGDTASNLQGGQGDDTLVGADGNDVLDGGSGTDLLQGGNSDDIYYVDSLNDAISETFVGGYDAVRVLVTNYILPTNVESGQIWTATGVKLSGNTEGNTLFGNTGNDTVFGGTGFDSIFGGDGNDSISGGINGDLLDGGGGNDVINGDQGLDSIVGGAGNDTVDGGLGADTIQGGDGFDIIVGSDGNDFVFGGLNGDQLNSGNGDDWIHGERGLDTINGGDGNDTLTGGPGSDQLTGGAGADVFVFNSPTDGLDLISDFLTSSDALNILAAGFGGGLTPGGAITLISAEALSSAHGGPEGYFILDDSGADFGALYWDSTGDDGTDAVAIAIVGSSLQASDIFIV